MAHKSLFMAKRRTSTGDGITVRLFARKSTPNQESVVTSTCLQASERYPIATPSVHWPIHGSSDCFDQSLCGVQDTDKITSDTTFVASTKSVLPETDVEMVSEPVVLTTITNASVYLTGGRHAIHTSDGELVASDRVANDRLAEIPWQSHQHLNGTSLVLGNSAGASCYYHWMLDLLPKIGFLERAGINLNSIDYFLVREAVTEFQRESFKKLGIDQSRIVQTVKQPYLTCDKVLLVKIDHQVNMTMHRFVPEWINTTFGAHTDRVAHWDKGAYADRGAHADKGTHADRGAHADKGAHSHQGEQRIMLYIKRPKNVRRAIRNADQVEQTLVAHGFDSVEMEGLSIDEQAQLLARTDVLVAQHGGALTNMVFAKPGTKIIELFGRHVYPFYFGLANVCRHEYFATIQNVDDYSCLVQKQAALQKGSDENVTSTQAEDFSVDIPALERVLAAALG